MKKFMQILTGILFLLLFWMSQAAMAYVIDGNLDDWGIDLSATGADQIHYLDNNLPSGGLDIDYTTEDNASTAINPARGDHWWEVGPLWSYYNYFDAEAIYFDNDETYAYIAIVQGLPKEGYKAPYNPSFKPGDIAIDADNDESTGEHGYEFGLDISDSSLYYVSDWNEVHYSSASISNPWGISTGTKVGAVSFVYSGEQNSHYVLEAAIPLSYLGLSADPGDSIQPLRIHWTQECGNDYLTLDADVTPIPEPMTMFLLGPGLLGLAGWGRKRFKKS